SLRFWGFHMFMDMVRARASRWRERRRLQWLLGVAVLAAAHAAAEAHRVARNPPFSRTLALHAPPGVDRPAPAVASAKHPAEGADVTDKGIGWSFSRLLTSTVAIGVESGWMHRNWGTTQRSGFDTTALTVKSELYKNELHEVMISAGLAWGIGHSGAQG